MLSSELHPDHESLAFIKRVLHGDGNAEEKLQHLREVMSENVIITGWLNDPQTDNSPETLITALRQRVDKYDANQHLREIETQALAEAEARAAAEAEAQLAAEAKAKAQEQADSKAAQLKGE